MWSLGPGTVDRTVQHASGGRGFFSMETQAIRPPGPVEGLRVTAGTSDALTFEWAPPLDAGSRPVLGYELPWNNMAFDYRHFVVLDERHVQAKIDALACYESQQHRPYVQPEFLRSWARSRGGQIFVDYAEAFDVLRWVMR